MLLLFQCRCLAAVRLCGFGCFKPDLWTTGFVSASSGPAVLPWPVQRLPATAFLPGQPARKKVAICCLSSPFCLRQHDICTTSLSKLQGVHTVGTQDLGHARERSRWLQATQWEVRCMSGFQAVITASPAAAEARMPEPDSGKAVLTERYTCCTCHLQKMFSARISNLPACKQDGGQVPQNMKRLL